MPRDLNSTSLTEKNKQENKPIFLYTLYDYDGASTNKYFAGYSSDVTFNGQVYTRFPIKHEAVSENMQGQIDSMRIQVSNVDRTIQALLEQYDVRGKQVDVMLVWANQLADTSAKIVDTFYIDTYSATDEAVEFVLTSKFDVLDIEIPQRKFTRNYCQWKFKSDECGYTGGESTCNKTKQRCKVLANYERFGGFPSIPPDRVIIG